MQLMQCNVPTAIRRRIRRHACKRALIQSLYPNHQRLSMYMSEPVGGRPQTVIAWPRGYTYDLLIDKFSFMTKDNLFGLTLRNLRLILDQVRREKISHRMKYLQDLVPGCNNITGKASVLDEIINYVQSLQKQVEV